MVPTLRTVLRRFPYNATPAIPTIEELRTIEPAINSNEGLLTLSMGGVVGQHILQMIDDTHDFVNSRLPCPPYCGTDYPPS